MDAHQFRIIKNTGESDFFSEDKLRQSLQNTGAKPELVDLIVAHVKSELRDGLTTKAIYKKAHQLLKRSELAKASRYKLKRAILELGPTGYPFELYIGELLRCLGYHVEIGINLQGKCVSHEVDVLAQTDSELLMLECKFHNRHGYKTDVKVPLYIDSRFRDLSPVWENDAKLKGKKLQGGVVTNARLTHDAITYGECAGLRMLSWDYPQTNNLKTLASQYHLYPITTLESLTKTEKHLLITDGIVTTNTLCTNFNVLEKFGLSSTKYEKVVREARTISEI